WGTLARQQFHTPPTTRVRPRSARNPASRGMESMTSSPSVLRNADPGAFRSSRLMEGAGEELKWPDPVAPKTVAPPLDLGWTPKFASDESSLAIPLPSLEG